MRRSYEEQLEHLQSEVLSMGMTVKQRFTEALTAMTEHNPKRADQIGKKDDEIDSQYLEVEKICADLLALQQPVAGDLRLILSSFKIVTDLERIGDLIVNLTDYTKQIEGPRLIDEQKILTLGNFAERMIADSLQAYQNQSSEKAREIASRDDQMDQLCEESTNHLLQYLIQWESEQSTSEAEQTEARKVTTELLAIRDLERVADHAVNIAARTIYMSTTKRDLI